jgi:hypothetical protein
LYHGTSKQVKQYLEILERYKKDFDEIYYRGQSEEYNMVTPSISRDDGYLVNESNIFFESVKIKPNEFESLISPLEKLSKMQHYGIPTRLIDLTIDPLIALFFAAQDIDCKFPGNIYVYLTKGCDFEDKKVKVLSLLAKTKNYDLDNLCKEFEREFMESISQNEFISLASNPVFIKHCEKLIKTNARLYHQMGCFVICGNTFENGKLKQELITLNAIKPNMVIRIPYEYKKQIKNELDQQLGINETRLYPELPSVGDYIKAKYKKENISLDGLYSIVEHRDISTGYAKRISITVTLNELLKIEYIQKLTLDLLKKYQSRQDVVWINVAKNGNDYIMNNWIFRAQWINPGLDKSFRPFTLKNDIGNGYSWEETNSFSVLSDFYQNNNFFVDDRTLFVCFQKVFIEILPIYYQLINNFEINDLSNFIRLVVEKKKVINDTYLQMGKFGYSRNKELNDYFINYEHFIISLDNLHSWIKNSNLNEKALRYQLNLCLIDTKKHIDTIEQNNDKFKKQLNVSEEDILVLDSNNLQIREYQYEPTIPISTKAINITFTTIVHENDDGTFKISGKTNLFSHANLMLSVRNNENKLLGQSKATVLDGYFEFEKMSQGSFGYDQGTYKANLSLSLPSLQPKEFTNLAGIEYENITGPYVSREGYGPGLNYYFTFEIKRDKYKNNE